jgi:hypothetical protein
LPTYRAFEFLFQTRIIAICAKMRARAFGMTSGFKDNGSTPAAPVAAKRGAEVAITLRGDLSPTKRLLRNCSSRQDAKRLPAEGLAYEARSTGILLPWQSWTPDESQVESCEHRDNANIRYQPFPELVPEEHEIHTDYNGCHRHHVKHDSYLFAHFSTLRLRRLSALVRKHC